MPSRPVLCLLLVLATVPPFVSQATHSVVGSFTMFNRVLRYHLDLEVREDGRTRPVTVRSLAPHLSRMSRAILLPADGQAVGADQVDVVANGLGDLTRLLCDVHPNAETVRARLIQDPFDAAQTSERNAERACGGSR
jgi:hypothetical protein